MKLTLDILLDELSRYNATTVKFETLKMEFSQIHYYHTADSSIDPSVLYFVDPSYTDIDFSHNCPNHIICLTRVVPASLYECAETIIQIPSIDQPIETFQSIIDIFSSYDEWNQSMLMAIVTHKRIDEFLDIAAQKLTNPIALLDNGMNLIAKSGDFKNPSKGTIWEKFEDTVPSVLDFYTLQEQIHLSSIAQSNKVRPYTYYPASDKTHNYGTSHIWIDNKLYGNLGWVDINSPITDGQLSIVQHITTNFKYFFQNNEDLMQIAENNTFFLNHLIDETPIDENIIAYQLRKHGWKHNDQFYLLNFTCPLPFVSPIESISYVKKINKSYPASFITIREQHILLLIRDQDYPLEEPGEKEKLERLLIAHNMNCGVSICFNDFKQLKAYYIQSAFAVEYSHEHSNSVLQYYENCYNEHLVQLLKTQTDLRCFCHPQILRMWQSRDENQRELINCLYNFLLNGANLATTSKALHLHRNTLIYRINKISQILGQDLKNLTSEQLLSLILSCMIVEYL